MTAQSQTQTGMIWHPGPAIAAWLLPGLGHYLIGEKKRGLIIMVALYALFIAGLLIGGIDVIDRRQDKLWYAGQIMMGPPAIVIDRIRERLQHEIDDRSLRVAETLPNARHHDQDLWVKTKTGPDRVRQWNNAGLTKMLQTPGEQPIFRKSVGRVNELGTLYCTLAGMLNLLVIMDVAFRRAPAPRTPPPTQQPKVGRVVTRGGKQ